MTDGFELTLMKAFLKHRKEFFVIDDAEQYKRVTVRLHAGGIVLRDEVYGSQLRTKKQQAAKSGELLVAEIDAKVGGVGIVPLELAGAIVSSHYFLYEIDETVCHPRYLEYYVRSGAVEEQFQEFVRGSTNYASIRAHHTLELQIPLPPMDEQRRIVARIEELAALIEETQGLRSKAREEAEALIASYISGLLLFNDNVWGTLQDAVLERKGSVRSGPFGSQLHHDEFVDSGVAAIGTRDVQVNRFILNSGWYVTPQKFEQFERYQVFPGDILVTIVGASIGRFCVVPEDIPLAFTTKHVIAATLDRSIAEPRFVSYMLNFHSRSRESIFSQTEGSAQPSLNSKKVRAIAVPLPPISEQRHIVAYLDDLQAQVDELTALQNATQAELDALLPSVLDKAFRGEL